MRKELGERERKVSQATLAEDLIVCVTVQQIRTPTLTLIRVKLKQGLVPKVAQSSRETGSNSELNRLSGELN